MVKGCSHAYSFVRTVYGGGTHSRLLAQVLRCCLGVSQFFHPLSISHPVVGSLVGALLLRWSHLGNAIRLRKLWTPIIVLVPIMGVLVLVAIAIGMRHRQLLLSTITAIQLAHHLYSMTPRPVKVHQTVALRPEAKRCVEWRARVFPHRHAV